MRRYLLRQIPQIVGVIFIVTTAVFLLSHLTGDPTGAMLPPEATQEQFDELVERLELDEPIPVQYARWITNAVQGDFGYSILRDHRPAMDMVLERLPHTLYLSSIGLALGIVFAVPLGILAAVRAGGAVDRGVSAFVLIGQAMPSFWFGIMMIIIFAVQLRWFPVSGIDAGWRSLALPAVTLAVHQAPPIMRIMRSSVADTLGQDYIRTARAKGLTRTRILFGHALRNASVPVVTIIALRVASLVSGAVIVEIVFAWPGVGDLLVTSINQADFPVIQATVLVIALGVVLANLLGDVLVAFVDPRVSYA